jgi:spermidine synthase
MLAAAGVGIAMLFMLALPSSLRFRGEAPIWQSQEPRLLYSKEADLGSVQVMALARRPGAMAMLIDGVVIGSNRAFSEHLHDKQILLAHLPMALDRNIRSTLSLGVATASTIKTLSRYPWVEKLEAVEINAAVIEGNRLFLDSIVLFDPRARVVVEDAIHHLLRSPDHFDLIVSDAKQNINFTGNARILTQDFYRFAMERLEPCGLFVQSIPLATEPSGFQMSLRTFRSVFPEMEVFAHTPGTAVFVGSRCPIGGRPRPTRDELKKAGVADEITEAFLPDPTATPTLWLMSGADVDEFVEPGPFNTWDRMAIEFTSYRAPVAAKEHLAANLRFVLRVQLESSREPPDFTAHPLYASMPRLHRANLNLVELNRSTAGDLFRGILEEHPDHALARRGRDASR